MPNSTHEDDRPIGHLPEKPTCGIMTSESKASGQMGCAMTNCKLVQCIRSRKPDGTITTTITGGTHSKPDTRRYFYFSSMYVARIVSSAADEKSSRRLGAAVEGIHDFVELQGCAEIVRAVRAATSTFRCDYCRPGSAE